MGKLKYGLRMEEIVTQLPLTQLGPISVSDIEQEKEEKKKLNKKNERVSLFRAREKIQDLEGWVWCHPLLA